MQALALRMWGNERSWEKKGEEVSTKQLITELATASKKKKKKIISQSFGAGNSINNGCVLVSSVGGKKMRNLCTGFFLNLVRYLSLVRFCPTIVNFGALSCSLNHWWSKTNRPLFLQQKWVYSDSAKNCSSGSIIMVNPVQEEHSSVERKRKLGGL